MEADSVPEVILDALRAKFPRAGVVLTLDAAPSIPRV